MYKFRLATNKEFEEAKKLQYGGSPIWDIDERGDEDFALFLGKAITLFGMPDNLSDDWENMYCYEITAEDEQGNKLLLMVYHGSGGFSIAIPTQYNNIDLEPYEQAKKELVQIIESQYPTDYEWESIYYDIPENVKYTVKDGIAYIKSEFGDIDEYINGIEDLL